MHETPLSKEKLEQYLMSHTPFRYVKVFDITKHIVKRRTYVGAAAVSSHFVNQTNYYIKMETAYKKRRGIFRLKSTPWNFYVTESEIASHTRFGESFEKGFCRIVACAMINP